MKKIILSYSAMNDLYTSPHSYLNKVMGIKIPENEYMTAGKKAHEAIQKHLLGEKNPMLADLDWTFGKAEHHAMQDYGDKYLLHGYLDCIDFKSKVICEIKSSSQPWSQQKFDNLIQWKYYAYVTGFRQVLFITCKPDLTDLKTYFRYVNDSHIQEVEAWVKGAIDILSGDLRSDLIDGHCELPRCPYLQNCYFKN